MHQSYRLLFFSFVFSSWKSRLICLSPADVLGHGTSSFENLKDYVTSLRKMLPLASGRAYPGHGAVIPEAPARISTYIHHRQQREDEIVRLLRHGKLEEASPNEQSPNPKVSWQAADLVKKIYPNVPETLLLAATHGVMQVLMKLEDEGRVVNDASGRWTWNVKRPAL